MQQLIRKNHMDISWHEYTDEDGANVPVTQASLTEKASIIGRVGIMLLPVELVPGGSEVL